MEWLFWSITVGVYGFLMAAVLTLPGEVLAWWPRLIDRLCGMQGKTPNDWNAFQYFIFKTAYGCSKCIAGQLAFWSSFFVAENIGQGFCMVVLSVFFAFAIEKHYSG